MTKLVRQSKRTEPPVKAPLYNRTGIAVHIRLTRPVVALNARTGIRANGLLVKRVNIAKTIKTKSHDNQHKHRPLPFPRTTGATRFLCKLAGKRGAALPILCPSLCGGNLLSIITKATVMKKKEIYIQAATGQAIRITDVTQSAVWYKPVKDNGRAKMGTLPTYMDNIDFIRAVGDRKYVRVQQDETIHSAKRRLQSAKPITALSELTEGETVNIYSSQFDVTNLCRFICGDTTELNRDIAYFQFADRGYAPIDREGLRKHFDGNGSAPGVFALWGHDLKHNTITKATQP